MESYHARGKDQDDVTIQYGCRLGVAYVGFSIGLVSQFNEYLFAVPEDANAPHFKDSSDIPPMCIPRYALSLSFLLVTCLVAGGAAVKRQRPTCL